MGIVILILRKSYILLIVRNSLEYCRVIFSIKHSKFSLYSLFAFDEKVEIQEKMCEESRILYVAMTRAIRNLVHIFNQIVDHRPLGDIYHITLPVII